MLIHAMVDRRSCRHHNLGKLSFGDLRLELADLPVSDSVSHQARPHATSARPARSPTVEPPAHLCELRVLVPGLPVCARPPFMSCAVLQVERT